MAISLLYPHVTGVRKLSGIFLKIRAFNLIWTYLVAQMVKRLPTMWETRVQSLGRVDLGERNGNPLQYSWRRKWQPTPVFLPGESYGRGGLVGCHICGRIESDTTEVT